MSDIPERIVQFLRDAGTSITVAMNADDIMERLEDYEYDRQRMEQGGNLLKKAETLASARRNTWVTYQTDGMLLKEKWKAVKEVYNDDIKLARIAFRYETGILDKLQARGTRKVAVGDWFKQANVFYTNALDSDDIIAGLSRFGLNRKKLKEHQKLVEGLNSRVAAKEALKGEARTLTKKRNKALKELADWIADLKTVVFIAFKGTQVPERMGWLVKSEGYKPVGRPKKKKQEEPSAEEQSGENQPDT